MNSGLLFSPGDRIKKDLSSWIPQTRSESKYLFIKYRPIYIERLGMTHPDDVFKLADENQLLGYYAMSYEFLISSIF